MVNYPSRKSVLIVEDVGFWRKFFDDQLKDKYDVCLAKDYIEAMKVIRRRRRPFHVLVTDLRLKSGDDTNVDGLRLLKEIKKVSDVTQSIVVTQYPSNKTRSAAYSDSALAYIPKRPLGGAFNTVKFVKTVNKAAGLAEVQLTGTSKARRSANQASSKTPNEISADSIKGKVDVGIITIKVEEFNAVLRRFPRKQIARGEGLYSISYLTTKSAPRKVIAITRPTEQGQIAANNVTTDMITDLNPRCIFLVGIAGGVPAMEFTLGDVVVANRILDFTREAVSKNKRVEYDVSGGTVPKRVRNLLAQLTALSKELAGWNTQKSIGYTRPTVDVSLDNISVKDRIWKNKIMESLNHYFGESAARQVPQVIVGPILSRDTLFKDSQLLNTLLSSARSVLAVDMESAGVYLASKRSDGDYPLFVIRGISDIVGFHRNPNWTDYACHTAAAFAHKLIVSGLLDR